MAYPVTIGSTLATQQGTRWEYDSEQGETRIYRWRGPTAAVQSKYTSLLTGSYDTISIDDQNGKAELEAQSFAWTPGGSATTSPAFDTVELEPHIIVRPIEFWFLNNTALNADQVMQVRKSFEDWGIGQVNFVADQQNLYDMLIAGYESYEQLGYVFRIRTGCSSRSSVTASYTDVGIVVTALPTWANPLMGTLPTQIDWLKRAPYVVSIGRSKWSISQEFWGIPYTATGGGWSKIIYGANAHGNP